MADRRLKRRARSGNRVLPTGQIRGPDGLMRGSTRHLLTDRQVRAVRIAFMNGATIKIAAAAAGVTERLLRTRLEDQLVAMKVGRGRLRPGGRRADPQPFVDIPEDEIQRRAEALRRERWTEEDHAMRWHQRYAGPLPDA